MNTLKDLASGLSRRLEEELRLYGELEEVLRRQIQALSKGAAEELGAATLEVETCNDLLLGAERRRRLLMSAIASELGQEDESLSLRRVAEAVPSDLGRILQRVGMKLRLRLREVVRLRTQSSSLLEKESRFSRTRLDWLVNQMRQDGYSADGKRQGRVARRHMIDRKA